MTKFLPALAGSSLIALAVSTSAWAQDTVNAQQVRADAQAKADEAGEDAEAIVVTGTQIRGIAPVGANVIGLTSDTMKSTGLTDSNQILAQIPQSNFFNMFVEPGNGAIGAGTVRIPLTRPNLRNIPVGVSGSGALTLVLMDGHHIVPAGIEQSVIDAGIVPPGMLDRMEVILDGASAVYGSDAVGGVINYITRKRFDGVDVSARYGFADDYWQADTSIIVGKTWGSGGISLNYEFAKQSGLLSGDRAYNAAINWVTALSPITGTPTGTQDAVGNYTLASGPPAVDDLTCDVANVRNNAQTNTFHVSGAGLAPNPQFCDASLFRSYSPASRRHSAFVVLQQDLTDSIKVDVTGFYVNRLQRQTTGPARQTANITPTNPYYRCNTLLAPCVGATSVTTQRVSFSYGPLLGDDFNTVDTTTELWQVTPTVTVDLGSDWQARGLFAYGESRVTTEVHQIDTTLQATAAAGTTLTTALNPYDIASPSNASIVNGLIWDDVRLGKHVMKDLRVIADGPVFTLPGGDVRVALGAEWQKVDFTKTLTNIAVPHNTFAPTSASASSKSAFGELVVPIFGDDNGFPGMESLILSVSGRYDDYGNGVNTFNPKIAVTYEPFDWLTLRGNWGTSFRGPNAADKLGASTGDIRCIGAQTGCTSTVQAIPTDIDSNPAIAGIQPYPSYTFAGNKSARLTLGGTDANLKPETSTGWSVGADLRPPFVPGLTLSATYWHIDFKNIINLPQTTGSLNDLFHFLPELFTVCRLAYGPNSATPYVGAPANQCAAGGSQNAALQAYLAQANGGQAVYDQAIANGLDIVYFSDTRIRNLGRAKISGVDASVSYRHDVGFGSIDLSVNGAWMLNADLSFTATTPLVDQIKHDSVKFRMTARLGATVGNFRAQASLRHQAGFTPNPQFIDGVTAGGAQRSPSQTRIPTYNVMDLAFVYNVNGDNLFEDLSFSLNINNVLDATPPLDRTSGGGTAGATNAPIQTLGRFFQFGVSKKF